MAGMDLKALAESVRCGDQISLARAISLVEDRRPGCQDLLRILAGGRDRSLRLGITGPPGSGKSTLVDKLISHFRDRDLEIGVVAVDPTSPISGGAILGDRIRMVRHASDPGVFIRSLASRGELGGLSRATADVIELMAAAGKELILIETVGVGQSEIDVVSLADVVVLVLTPASGDEIQVFKAGIIEVADIFVVNKADLGGAETRVNEIRSFFSLSGKEPRIFQAAARHDHGVVELAETLLSFKSDSELIATRRKSLHGRLVLRLVEERVRREIKETPVFISVLAGADSINPYQAADEIYNNYKRGGNDDQKNRPPGHSGK